MPQPVHTYAFSRNDLDKIQQAGAQENGAIIFSSSQVTYYPSEAAKGQILGQWMERFGSEAIPVYERLTGGPLMSLPFDRQLYPENFERPNTLWYDHLEARFHFFPEAGAQPHRGTLEILAAKAGGLDLLETTVPALLRLTGRFSVRVDGFKYDHAPGPQFYTTDLQGSSWTVHAKAK